MERVDVGALVTEAHLNGIKVARLTPICQFETWG